MIPFVQLNGSFSRQVFIMAAGYHRRVLDTITSLGDDGIVVSSEDYNKFEALIGDYFNVDSSSDESGNEEDVECGKYFLTTLKGLLHFS